MDARRLTGIVIRRGNAFLVGVVYGSRELRWSASPWDAWITRRREQARAVCGAVGGEMVLFNPATGQRKPM